MTKGYLNNTTPFAADFSVFSDEHGQPMLSLVVKCSYRLTHDDNHWTPELKKSQPPVLSCIERLPAPNEGILAGPTELYPNKPGCDLIVIATARPPTPNLASFDCRLEFKDKTFRCRVFGKRQWRKTETGYEIEPISPATDTPVDYLHAYGGAIRDDTGNIVAQFPQNPNGMGYYFKSYGLPENWPLPLIEDPGHLITHPDVQPLPTAMTAIPEQWTQRTQFAGTYDESWQRDRCPLLPADFDTRFYQQAHPELILRNGLHTWDEANERVKLLNLGEPGHHQLSLPPLRSLEGIVDINGQVVVSPLTCDTVLINLDARQLTLFYRANVSDIGSLHRVKSMRVQDANNIKIRSA